MQKRQVLDDRRDREDDLAAIVEALRNARDDFSIRMRDGESSLQEFLADRDSRYLISHTGGSHIYKGLEETTYERNGIEPVGEDEASVLLERFNLYTWKHLGGHWDRYLHVLHTARHPEGIKDCESAFNFFYSLENLLILPGAMSTDSGKKLQGFLQTAKSKDGELDYVLHGPDLSRTQRLLGKRKRIEREQTLQRAPDVKPWDRLTGKRSEKVDYRNRIISEYTSELTDMIAQTAGLLDAFGDEYREHYVQYFRPVRGACPACHLRQ